MTTQQKPIRVALLGAGIFATTSHAPVIKGNPKEFECIAVWSRKEESAAALASELNAKSFSGDEGLEKVLNDPDLDSVIMALPLDVQPKFIKMALEAGKNVLSEKPIAATVSEAKDLVDFYGKKYSNLQWSIAENFRYEPALLKVADAVKTAIGKPFLASLTVRAPFRPDNKYLNTPWRNKPSWYGGLFIDAFVHASAMLRMVLGEAKTVSAVTSSNADYIPSVDTMAAQVEWVNGVLGAVSVTYACSEMKFEFEVTGTEGKLFLQRKTDGPGYRLVVNGNSVEEFGFGGIEAEFMAFADACRKHQQDRNSPEEALRDLAFVEACLKSGQKGGETVIVGA